jgi:hypothetical protein
VYSVGPHGPTPRVAEALEFAVDASGRVPDLVLSGHDHNYQRFTRDRQGRQIPYLVVGAGGFTGYQLSKVHKKLGLPEDITLEASNNKHPGFLRITVNKKRLVGEYFVVPEAGKENKREKRNDKFVLDLKKHRLIQ